MTMADRADRNAYLGDPEYLDVPPAGLLSQQYVASRRALIKPRQAMLRAR